MYLTTSLTILVKYYEVNTPSILYIPLSSNASKVDSNGVLTRRTMLVQPSSAQHTVIGEYRPRNDWFSTNRGDIIQVLHLDYLQRPVLPITGGRGAE